MGLLIRDIMAIRTSVLIIVFLLKGILKDRNVSCLSDSLLNHRNYNRSIFGI